MKTYMDCWISAATTLFSQALAGEPHLAECELPPAVVPGQALVAEISGDVTGNFTVMLDREIVKSPLLGEGADQTGAWVEFLREIAESAAGDFLSTSGKSCRIEAIHPADPLDVCTRGFRLVSPGGSWMIWVLDALQYRNARDEKQFPAPRLHPSPAEDAGDLQPEASSGVELLLDVELEAALRFGCRELPLGEILELGPGDVVELDRHVTDPVDLIVGDKIVARGEVVLVNGNFGLRVTEVATPQKRLESIRCLF
ncbi:FliM/FliN family flagellar motor switch protein [Telmatobacter sp. DSM 110680]|uniref:Flagellar motor switch protein FliN n=1 Tax=Telmatobacter sp. DSM 110680 TaxID=3036704 RepID=A0AAU7DFQ5_9BACT